MTRCGMCLTRLRYVARSGCAWRMIPGDLPPWAAVYQKFRSWLEHGCIRGAGVGCAIDCTRVGWTQGPAERGLHGQPHPAVHP